MSTPIIFMSADHGGWKYKQALVQFLRQRGYQVIDLGPVQPSPQDDYPLWAARVAREVQLHPQSRGIALCRTSVGMALVANKFRGLRAAQAWNQSIARRSRTDEDANFLSLPADDVTLPVAKKIIQVWLQTKFKPVARYRRRLRQIRHLDHGR